jgi:3-oxoacyl-[acyl-carrier protein] reductase
MKKAIFAENNLEMLLAQKSENLKGRSALVCGGSKGIGFASAIYLAEMGAKVTILARNESDLQEAVIALPSPNPDIKHSYIACDTNNIEELKSKIMAKQSEQGQPYLILVNNSGGPPAGPISSASNEDFQAAFHQHLIVNHTISLLLIPAMKENHFGRIINVISTSVKQPLPNLGVSNTIRAAVANWSKTMANELAKDGITVNNVLPGATETDRLATIIQNKAAKTGSPLQSVTAEMLHEIPAGRFGQPREIAAAIGFLASTESSYITGINIPVDGGRTGNL